MSATHRADLLELCEKKFMHEPFINPGRMMGHPGFKTSINNKFFLFLYDDGLALKLPPDLYKVVLDREDVIPFQPSRDKKPMSTWVVWILAEPNDYEKDWLMFINSAIDYTASEAPNPKKKK